MNLSISSTNLTFGQYDDHHISHLNIPGPPKVASTRNRNTTEMFPGCAPAHCGYCHGWMGIRPACRPLVAECENQAPIVRNLQPCSQARCRVPIRHAHLIDLHPHSAALCRFRSSRYLPRRSRPLSNVVMHETQVLERFNSWERSRFILWNSSERRYPQIHHSTPV